jgi:NAD(P)-dependent dehydrogenase (short-subunit alcohol dehydrogenase family)
MKVAWCTGAGKGIGRAVALRLAERGYGVAASARTVADLEGLVSEAGRRGLTIKAFPLDVRDEAAVAATVGAIEHTMGAIELAVLNAGTHMPVNLETLRPAVFRDLMEINFMGVVHGLAALLPAMTARRRGQIAVVSSVAGYRGLPTAAAYGASKAALINMCEALKPEMDRAGIKLALINPGFVKTPLTDKNEFEMPFLIEADEAARRIISGLSQGRFEITFPKRFTWVLKVLRCLPYPLYFALVERLVRK